MNFTNKYQNLKNLIDLELETRIKSLNSVENTLKDAMAYSLLNGGKRLRAVLMLAVADFLGVDRADVIDYCVAIECIHAYSLIHDDLPAMDNDDLRRGKPTSHKVYGEAMAILAGDALLNYAYEVILKRSRDLQSLSASRLISLYAGAFGMVGGQALDVLCEGGNYLDSKEDILKKIHDNKTGKLISASVLVPSCLKNNLYFENLSAYGKNLGYLFQVTDDILDFTSTPETLGKTVGKDENENKLTFVTLYGIEKSKEFAIEYYNNAYNAVKELDGSKFLIDILNFVKTREF